MKSLSPQGAQEESHGILLGNSSYLFFHVCCVHSLTKTPKIAAMSTITGTYSHSPVNAEQASRSWMRWTKEPDESDYVCS